MQIFIKTLKVNGQFEVYTVVFVFLLPILVMLFPFGKVLKRESGENPEQTRCCKLLQNL